MKFPLTSIIKAAIPRCVIVWLVLALFTGGCARFVVPAPDEPVQPVLLPQIGDSVMTLPLKLQTAESGITSLLEGSQGPFAAKVRRFLSRQAMKFDERLLRNAVVQQTAGWAWEALQSPIRIKNDAYLLLNPETLSLSIPQQKSNDSEIVIAVLELTARPKLVAGIAPDAVSRSTPSLVLTPVTREPGFRVALETEISFKKISIELTEQQKNKVYAPGNGNIRVTGVRMYASGSSVVLEVRVAGDREGILYLSGVPHYDPETRTLSLRNLDYTVATKNVLVKVAEWMLHTELRARIEEQARWPLGGRIEEAGDLLNKALNREINSHISLSGIITRIEPVAIGVTRDSIKALFEAKGSAELMAR